MDIRTNQPMALKLSSRGTSVYAALAGWCPRRAPKRGSARPEGWTGSEVRAGKAACGSAAGEDPEGAKALMPRASGAPCACGPILRPGSEVHLKPCLAR